MSKGKYATRATLRREDQSVRSEIDGYQHNLRKLSAENKELRAQLAAERTEHRKEARLLRSMLAEGISPELNALERRCNEERERADRSVAHQKGVQESYEKLTTFITRLLHNVTGCTGLEATEALGYALGNPAWCIADTFTGADRHGPSLDPERVQTLQRTRGFRSSPKVIEHLNDLCSAAARKSPKLRAKARSAQ